MAWYRSIGIDTPDIVKPEFIEEYKESAIGYTQARTFTVVNPGLYFLANFGTSTILTLSTSSQNPILYDMAHGARTNDNFRLMHLDAGDTVTYGGDNYNTQCWTYLAIRIVNAEFSSTKYTERTAAGATLTYSNEIDANPHFIFYKVNGSSIGIDNSDISQDCNVLNYGITGNAWSSAKCIGLVSNDDLAYINTAGNATSVVLDFVLQPISPKIAGTLPAGQSTITLYDQRIRSGSNVSVLTSNGAWYRDIDVTDGSCTIEFPIQDTDISVEIEVS